MTAMKSLTRAYPFILAGTAVSAVLSLFFLSCSPDPVPVNIITDHGDITAEDYRRFMGRRTFDHPDPATLFANGAVTRQTIPFLNHLAEQVRDLPESEREEAVNNLIRSILGPSDHTSALLQISRIYRVTLEEEGRHRRRWFSERDMEKLIANLLELQELRRSRFGKKTADTLFGTEIKSFEYALRKHGIITDKKATGLEKEKRLASLRVSMWGEEAATVDAWQTPAQRCEEKIALYENDFEDLDEEERRKRIRKIRLDYFTPEEVNRMEAADRREVIARRRDREYYRRSRPIIDDRDITDTEKSELLMELQHEIYGSPGGAGRR